MPGVTIERMKEGYSQIRNRALAYAFSYMNLIEGWGTGIPRLLQEMKEYGLPEPEFIDMEIALRINLYRKTELNLGIVEPENAALVPNDAELMPNSTGLVPHSDIKCRINAEELPEQQAAIYRLIVEREKISSAEVEQLLGVKQRRARAVLKDMVGLGIIKKTGAARSTRYSLQ